MFDDWMAKVKVYYSLNSSSEIKNCAKIIAKQLKASCIEEKEWSDPRPIKLEISIQFHPKGDIIVGYHYLEESEILHSPMDSEYIKYMGCELILIVLEFIRKELIKKLGWSDG